MKKYNSVRMDWNVQHVAGCGWARKTPEAMGNSLLCVLNVLENGKIYVPIALCGFCVMEHILNQRAAIIALAVTTRLA